MRRGRAEEVALAARQVIPLGIIAAGPDYRASSCKLAFQLWGDTLRETQLQLLNKKLREQQVAAKAAVTASRGGRAECTNSKGYTALGSKKNKQKNGRKKQRNPEMEDTSYLLSKGRMCPVSVYLHECTF